MWRVCQELWCNKRTFTATDTTFRKWISNYRVIESTGWKLNECAIMESLLSVSNNSNALLDKGQLTGDNYAKDESTPVSIIQNVYERSLGRPKKTGVTLQVS